MTTLRAALLALVERWEDEGAAGVSIKRWLRAKDVRALLAAHPEPEADPLHPAGRCACFGEGRCTWCRRSEAAEPPAGAARVRIAVAVDADGAWHSAGSAGMLDAHALSYARGGVGDLLIRTSWIEAWVPRPEAETTIEGEVSWSDGRVEEHEQ